MAGLSRMILGCTAAATLVSGAAASQPPSPSPNAEPHVDVVIVRGCLTGRTLVSPYGTGSTTPQRYELTGDRRTVKALKEHSHHTEEITGTLQTRDAKGATRGVDRRWGKNRVYAGAAHDRPSDPPSPATGPLMRVTAMKHVSDYCGQP